MNEASKTKPFLTKLRRRCPYATIIKHVSMSGVPDVTASVRRFTLWIEIKLYRPGKRWDEKTIDFLAFARDSPVQYENVKRLEGLYVIFVAKAKEVWLWNPSIDTAIRYAHEDAVLDALELILRSPRI